MEKANTHGQCTCGVSTKNLYRYAYCMLLIISEPTLRYQSSSLAHLTTDSEARVVQAEQLSKTDIDDPGLQCCRYDRNLMIGVFTA